MGKEKKKKNSSWIATETRENQALVNATWASLWLSGKDSAANAGDVGSFPGSGRSPGEAMATHSSSLAWRIPWTEEPGRLQSIGSQGVRHD